MCKECTVSVLRKWGVKILTSAHSFQMHSFIFLFCCSETSTSAQQICIKDFQPGSVHTLYKIPSAMWYQFRKLFWGEKWKLWSCTYRLSYNFTGKERWQFIYIKFSKIYISIDGTSVMTELLVPRFTSSDNVCADSRTVLPSSTLVSRAELAFTVLHELSCSVSKGSRTCSMKKDWRAPFTGGL